MGSDLQQNHDLPQCEHHHQGGRKPNWRFDTAQIAKELSQLPLRSCSKTRQIEDCHCPSKTGGRNFQKEANTIDSGSVKGSKKVNAHLEMSISYRI